MGKAARWLRGLFNIKRPDPNPNPNPNSNKPSSKDKRNNKWSFVKSYKEKSTDVPATDPTSSLVGPSTGLDDASKHAIAVAAATAAVAEAAVAAAHAAAAVVRLTSGGTCNATPTMQVQVSYGGDEETYFRAALVIQSYFRTYLARRALRALKGLVKLQALVRGHIMRKKTKETMRCMQAMLRAQARARSVRASFPESPQSSTKSSSQNQHPGPPTPEKFELVHAKSAKHDQTPKIKRNGSRTSWSNIVNTDKGNLGSSWSDPRMDEPTWDHLRGGSSTRTCLTDDERADRILEVDPGKPFFNIRRRNLFQSSYSGLLTSDHISHSYTTSKDSTHLTVPSPVSCEAVQSLNPLKLSQEIEDGSYFTAENSPPQLYSSGSQGGGLRKGPFTPAKSDGSRSFLSGYSDCPSYMAYTESAKAKMRSHSAPKQRPQYERTSSTKRYSVHGFGEHNPRSHAQRGSTMQTSFPSKAYPGSGRLDRLGMPVRDSTVVYYSGYLN